MNHHQLTLPVHFRADHRIPLLSPSQFPYSEDWWPYLCKIENKQTYPQLALNAWHVFEFQT